MCMNQKYVTAWALILLALPILFWRIDTYAATQNVNYVCDYPLQITNWQNDNSNSARPFCQFPKHNLSLGQLKSILIEISGDFETQLRVENLDGAEQLFSLEITAAGELTAEGTPTSQLSLKLSQPYGYSDSLPAADGQLDYAGNSGKIISATTQTQRNSITVSDPAILERFASSDGQNQNRLLINASSKSSITGNANLATITQTKASMRVNVTYAYDTASQVLNAETSASSTLSQNDSLTNGSNFNAISPASDNSPTAATLRTGGSDQIATFGTLLTSLGGVFMATKNLFWNSQDE
jgi:hypothetical protein